MSHPVGVAGPPPMSRSPWPPDPTLARSQRREVRNPILALPAARRVQALSPEQRAVLAEILEALGEDARQRAQDCWTRHKAPMAAYWKACSVYARHLARVLRPRPKRGRP